MIDGEIATRTTIVNCGCVRATRGRGDRTAETTHRGIHRGGEIEYRIRSRCSAVGIAYHERTRGGTQSTACTDGKNTLVHSSASGIGVGASKRQRVYSSFDNTIATATITDHSADRNISRVRCYRDRGVQTESHVDCLEIGIVVSDPTSRECDLISTKDKRASCVVEGEIYDS